MVSRDPKMGSPVLFHFVLKPEVIFSHVHFSYRGQSSSLSIPFLRSFIEDQPILYALRKV